MGVCFRHGGWTHDRNRVIDAMARDPEIPERRRLAFIACGSGAYVEARQVGDVHKTTEYRLRSSHCRDRFCIPCANARAAIVRDNLLRHLYQKPNLSLITLTLKGTDQDLKTLLDRAYAHFSELRALKAWKDRVKAGVAVLETKIGADGKRWHVHWHIVCQAKYFDQGQLSKLWHKITGDSMVVDVRRVGAINGAVSYVTKYITKAVPTQVLRSPPHLAEALKAFTGRRLLITFGEWRGLELTERPDDGEHSATETGWQCIGRLEDLWEKYKQGDAEARRIIPMLWRPNCPTKPTNPDTG